MSERINTTEGGSKIIELEGMMVSFESRHSLEELHAITELSPDLATSFQYADDLASPERIEKAIQTYEKHNPAYVDEYRRKIAAARALVLTLEDARRFKIRTAAKKDLAPIVASLNNLKGNKDYEKLNARYLLLSNAVGKISGNKVNHE